MKFGWVILAVGVAAFLAGCGQADKKQADAPKAPENGHWVVVPASTQPFNGGIRFQVPVYSAWRIDTQTGALEFCMYDPGGTPMPNGSVTQESFTCSKQVEAPSLP